MVRLTRQRKAILEVLRRAHEHLTAEEVYAAARGMEPRISLGTVYRNLDILVEEGLIQKITTGSGPMRFDGNPEKHAHLRCQRCGTLEDLPMKKAFDPREYVDSSLGHVVRGAVLEFHGLCRRCAAEPDA
ncbi:MAG: transcriptional repressor [Desulfosoma sp.]